MVRPGGFSLIEILIVLSIISILATIGIANFLQARSAAQVRAAELHVRNAFVIASAYVSETLDANVVPGNCMLQYVAGGFVLDAPSSNVLVSCAISDDDNDRRPEVEAELNDGTVLTFP